MIQHTTMRYGELTKCQFVVTKQGVRSLDLCVSNPDIGYEVSVWVFHSEEQAGLMMHQLMASFLRLYPSVFRDMFQDVLDSSNIDLASPPESECSLTGG